METAKQQFLEQTHQTILKVGFESNDYKIVADLTSPKFVAFGTALDEKIFGLKDLKALLKHQKEQAKGIDIKLNVNNLYTHISEDENTAVYIDEVILAITNDGESIDMLLRLSVVLEYIEDKWMMVHFHSSKPEHVESDKDTWGIETWKAKAEQLEKEVAERTADLVLKNKDLEIESALERVRSASMAMQKTEDISEVVTVLFDQLNHLNVPFLQIWITILNLDKDYIDIWMSPAEGVYETSQHFTMPSLYFEDTAIKTWRSKAPFSYRSLKSESEIDEFINACDAMTESTYFSHGRKIQNYNQLEFIEARHEYGFISKSNTEPPTETEANILQRFAKVFEQAYTRFLDIEKAEAQTREAQIEAAVERVRAKAMAMHQSSELSDVLTVLFEQFDILGVNPVWAHLSLIDLEENTFTYRMTGPKGTRHLAEQVVSLDARPEWQDSVQAFKNAESNMVSLLHFPKEVLPQVWELFSETLNSFPKGNGFKYEDFPEGLYNTQGHCKFGYIGFNHNRPPTDEEKDIVKRFAKEFGRLYQRFLDIKKAEAQTREAQIEAALEKVRSWSLAMQSSDELQDVVQVVAEKLAELNVVLEIGGIAISTYFENSKDVMHWTASHDPLNPSKPYFIEYYDTPMNNDAWEAKLNGESFFEKVYDAKDCKHYFDNALENTEYKNLPEEYKKLLRNTKQHGLTFAIQKNSTLMVPSLEGKLLNGEHKDILMRFSKVFEQAYIRFMDLERAEKQAREAQIEAALEKVRNRSLVMQTSDELQEVVHLVAEKMQELGVVVDPVGVIICTYPEGTKDVIHWTYTEDNERSKPYYIPYFKHPIWDETYASFNSEDPYFSKTYEKKDKHSFLKRIYTDPNSDYSELPLEFKDWQLSLPLYNLSFGWGSNSAVLIPNNDGIAPNESQKDIIIRFARVFDQCYIRFLDLKKSEAQAREAQIQLSLERVRAKAMSMRQSEELTEVLPIIFEQLDSLGVKTVWTHLTLLDLEKSKFTYRMTGREGKRVFAEQVVDFDASDVWQNAVDAFKAEEPDSIVTFYFPPETLPGIWDIFDGIFSTLSEGYKIHPEDFPEGIYTTQANCEFGYIGINNTEKATEEEENILARFAKEFGSLYRRFLDLQKAEAQVRESQIETALEKVRSTSMAMHKSAEMQEVANAVYEQMENLGIEIHVIGMSGEIQPESAYEVWVGGSTFTEPLLIPYTDSTEIQRQYNKAIAERPELYQGTFSGDVKKEYIDFLISETDIPKPLKKLMQESSAKTTSISFSQNSSIQIVRYTEVPYSEEDNSILVRFAKVFNQAYIRFLDLQKAEYQAREAQIEASLERVRAKAMAMHQTDELTDVLCILFDQFEILGVNPALTHLTLFDEANDTFSLRITTSGKKRAIAEQIIDVDAIEAWRTSYENWKKSELHALDLIDYKAEDLPLLWEVLDEVMSALPDENKIYPEDFPNGLYTTQGHCKFGYLGLNSERKATEEEKDIVVKFAKEFGRLYQRFLDLQKAEAQAREAQIEAALEKVRSRTMAMQTSSELPEAANTLFLEVQALGIPAWSAGYCIWNEDKSLANCNMSSEGEIQKGFMLPTIGEGYDFETPLKKGEKFHVASLGGKELVKHYDFMKTLPGVGDILSELINSGLELPTFQIFHICYFKHGYVMFITYEPVPNAHDIFKRFSAVFEQTYTRFLDLERAEAQTREAQIEMALEKVRSRTMAMQKGEELKEVVVLLYKELIKLGVTNFVTCGYVEINEATQRQLTWVTNPGGDSLGLFYLPLTGDATFDERYEAWKNQQEVFHQTVAGKVRQKHLEYAITTFNSKEAEEMVLSQFPDPTVFYCFNFPQGYLHIVSGSRLDPEEENVLARFTRVFEQTYTRFLDLERAEAQAKESQIEMALEKVRSRTMAMQHSDELQEAAQVLFNEVQNLGIPSWSCGYNILSDDKKSAECWMSSEGSLQEPFTLTYEKDKYFIEQYNFFKSNKVFLVQEQKGKDLEESYEYMKTIPKIGEIIADLEESGISLPTHQFNHLCKFNKGYLLFITYEAVPEAHDIFKRFGKVFEQTYTRFLDLKKAEAQAREAQIEAALERVRSKSIGMQKSKELANVVLLLDEELNGLGIEVDGTQILTDFDNPEKTVNVWFGLKGQDYLERFHIPYYDHPVRKKFHNALENEVDFYVEQYSKTVKNSFFKLLFKNSDFDKIPKERQEFIFDSPGLTRASVLFKNSILIFQRYNISEFLEEEIAIFKRFSKVFEQAYTRFLDLQKAEAQAREAQIEAALERVRSQSMGMQSTSDFGAVTTEMFTQLRNFGEELFATGIVFCDKHEGHVEQWHSIPGAGMVSPFIVPIDLDYIHQYRYDQWKKGEELFSIEIPSDFIEQHFQDIFDLPSAQIALKDLESRNAPMPEAPPYEIDYGASFEHGYVLISSLKPLENTDILIRFTKVFEQAYTRFLDLKKAEKRAREAQIEMALEKVRSRTMAMQSSEELAETSVIVFKQLLELGIAPNRLFIGIINDEADAIEAWATNEDGSKIERHFTLHASENNAINKMVKGWKTQLKSTIIDLKGKELQDYFHYLNNVMKIPFIHGLKQKRRIQTIAYFSGGLIGMAAPEEQPQETLQLLERFASVFNLTYTRFKDLKKAEAQARESQIEAALEKIRSRSLAMQSPDELQEVVALVAEKLKELGVIFDAGGVILCTYFPDNKDVVHWIAVDDFSTSGRYLVPYFDNPIYSEAWDSKIRGDTYFSKEFPVEAKNHFFKHAFEHSDYKHMPEDYKDFVLKSEQHRLSAAWSKNSAILIPSLTGAVPSESDAEIMKRFANVFEHAYIRFMDLQEKELQAKALFDEKQRLEKTLSDLQTTQKQLIQSEKMASLGELTAGIAHEIQNPLNFVNNFSEVSKELLEEMQEEIENGDYEEVKAIMADVIQNLEKINHHGQRADGIVKGMLQHSRASGDKKEPTDINKLADEYMRLAYHGLRAKNKQFNATLETDFDQSLPKTPIIPQDIGRVILNLFTNAFFAVEEKKTSSNDDGYEPTVSVSTKQKKDSIEITVKDNGNGIPEHIKDKIFQPFFTTKPTGQGTGLGLSMSYDIITKGHGGELKVETKQNEGTSFIIILPTK